MGVFDALQPLLGAALKIKWPNDIYYNDKKLGGILIENLVQGEKIKNSVVGIGLNINEGDFPDWVPNAISVKQILHGDYDKHLLLSDICRNIEAWYLNLKAGKVELVRKTYLSRLYWLNEQKAFKTSEGVLNGAITSVRDNGLLIVKNNNSREQEFSLKEIEFLAPQPPLVSGGAISLLAGELSACGNSPDSYLERNVLNSGFRFS